MTITGDGGFLMNVQELETATRLGLPLVVLIFRDNGYGSIRWKQVQRFQRTAGVEFGTLDFVRLADAFGCRGFRVESAAELAPILKEALAHPGPAVIDCPVDYRENNRLIEECLAEPNGSRQHPGIPDRGRRKGSGEHGARLHGQLD